MFYLLCLFFFLLSGTDLWVPNPLKISKDYIVSCHMDSCIRQVNQQHFLDALYWEVYCTKLVYQWFYIRLIINCTLYTSAYVKWIIVLSFYLFFFTYYNQFFFCQFYSTAGWNKSTEVLNPRSLKKLSKKLNTCVWLGHAQITLW